MPRVAIDYRSASNNSYYDFKKSHPEINITLDEWRNILYMFNEEFKTYILETGEKVKLPGGIGEFSINKKKRKHTVISPIDGKEYINLPVDWKKSKEKGKKIYNFNYHTDGFFFGWVWFKSTARFKYSDLWYFRASRVTSRLLAHYIKTDEKYKHQYRQWKF